MTKKEYRRQYYLKNKETVLVKQKERYLRKKEQILAYASNWHKQNRKLYPDKYKDRKLRADYGIGLEEFNVMRKAQDYSCAICQINERELSKAICVDHNHITGAVRGLLCEPCNKLLGNAKERIWILQNAINYLEKYA